MPRKKARRLDCRKIRGVGLFADGPKRSGRTQWGPWPLQPSVTYNTVAGTLWGYRVLSRLRQDDAKLYLVDLDEAEIITGIPRKILKGRWWAATEGLSYAWPWTTVHTKNDNVFVRLPSLLYWSQWAWIPHVQAHYGVGRSTVRNWIDILDVKTGENPFRTRQNTRGEVLYMPDVIQAAAQSGICRLMRGATTLEDVEPLTHLSPRAIADLKLGGRWLSTVGGYSTRK